MKAQWPVFTVELPHNASRNQWEVFSARAISELGCLGIEELGAPNPAAAPASARLFFPKSERRIAISRAQCSSIETLAGQALEASVKITTEWIADQDWGEGWKKFFHRTQVTPRLFVAPPWEAKLPARAPRGSVIIAIDPGLAFGTGTHATTQLCLAMIERHAIKNGVLLDIGAGSGILSIAAIKLGFGAALALESDPVCRENFQRNARLNRVTKRIHFVEGNDPKLAFENSILLGVASPDLIVCNMLSHEFEPLLASMQWLHRPMILSGYLRSEEVAVEQSARAAKWTIVERESRDEWSAAFLAPEAAQKATSARVPKARRKP